MRWFFLKGRTSRNPFQKHILWIKSGKLRGQESCVLEVECPEVVYAGSCPGAEIENINFGRPIVVSKKFQKSVSVDMRLWGNSSVLGIVSEERDRELENLLSLS